MILSGFKINNFPVGSWTPGYWKGFAEQRESVEVHVLSTSPGRGHLLLVNYLPGHSIHQEWVFNGPRIDEQPVVWARDREEIAPILNYYPDRHVWRVTVGSPFEPIDLKRLRHPLDPEAKAEASVED